MNAALNDNPEATAEERIAQVLLAKGRLKEADHGRALRLQTESGGALSGLLVRLGMNATWPRLVAKFSDCRWFTRKIAPNHRRKIWL